LWEEAERQPDIASGEKKQETVPERGGGLSGDIAST
jgi:hypothetical protein